MRILMIRPGPQYSVADVHRGWKKGLLKSGCVVGDVVFDAMLDFFWNAHLAKADGEYVYAMGNEDAVHMAGQWLYSTIFTFNPDAILVTSGFFLDEQWYETVRGRLPGRPVILLDTESPYEDVRQIRQAEWADVVIVNDPTNLDEFRAVNPRTFYIPHAYDPDIHHPRDPDPDLVSDFAFVGTLYPERQQFLEAVDWAGIDIALGGNMTPLMNGRYIGGEEGWDGDPQGSPLLKHVLHDAHDCLDNDRTALVYASTQASLNLYRRQALSEAHVEGWAMGPREVELAACRTFYLTEARGENRDVLPMVPTFLGPEDFGYQLRWWLDHPAQRERVVTQAATAIADRTFEQNARRLLGLLAH